MEEAKTDVTYCVHPTCRCWRHESNFNFREDRLYSFMACCERLNRTEQVIKQAIKEKQYE